jgi:hypothetical protein
MQQIQESGEGKRAGDKNTGAVKLGQKSLGRTAGNEQSMNVEMVQAEQEINRMART